MRRCCRQISSGAALGKKSDEGQEQPKKVVKGECPVTSPENVTQLPTGQREKPRNGEPSSGSSYQMSSGQVLTTCLAPVSWDLAGSCCAFLDLSSPCVKCTEGQFHGRALGLVLCCHQLEILNNKEPHIFILHWLPQIMQLVMKLKVRCKWFWLN